MSLAPDSGVFTPDEPSTTKEGRRRFVDYQPHPLALLTTEQALQLSGEQRTAPDERRHDYHAELPLVHTPTIRQVLNTCVGWSDSCWTLNCFVLHRRRVVKSAHYIRTESAPTDYLDTHTDSR